MILFVFLLLALTLLYRIHEPFSEKLIDKVMYINLDYRTDRRKEIESELNKKGLDYERFSAIKDSNGAIGCCKSHLAVLKKAREHGYKHILVLEDDFTFTVDTSSFHRSIQQLFQVPFDVCLLAYNTTEVYPTEHPFLYKVTNAQTASGYLVHSRYYDTLIEQWEYGLQMLQDTGDEQMYTCDQSWKMLQERDTWFCFHPRMGIQRESYSDIQKGMVSYGI